MQMQMNAVRALVLGACFIGALILACTDTVSGAFASRPMLRGASGGAGVAFASTDKVVPMQSNGEDARDALGNEGSSRTLAEALLSSGGPARVHNSNNAGRWGPTNAEEVDIARGLLTLKEEDFLSEDTFDFTLSTEHNYYTTYDEAFESSYSYNYDSNF